MKKHQRKPVFGYFILLFIAFSGLAIIKAQEKQPPRKSFEEIVNKPVVYTISGMEQTQIKKDVVYKTDAATQLKLDVYTPPRLGKGEKRAVVFLIHGGAPPEARPKDWGIYASWGKLIAASDMIGVVFTHRMGFPKPEFAIAESDLTDAIKYVRENADSLGADKERIALVSFSAGGPLLSVPLRDAMPYVRALAAFYSFLDVQQSRMHIEQIKDAEVLKKYSPISYLASNPANVPPIFVARAGRDEIPGINAAADRFIAEALSKNVAIEVMNHPAGVHGFDNQTDDERSRLIIRRALHFLRENLNKSTN